MANDKLRFQVQRATATSVVHPASAQVDASEAMILVSVASTTTAEPAADLRVCVQRRYGGNTMCLGSSGPAPPTEFYVPKERTVDEILADDERNAQRTDFYDEDDDIETTGFSDDQAPTVLEYVYARRVPVHDSLF